MAKIDRNTQKLPRTTHKPGAKKPATKPGAAKPRPSDSFHRLDRNHDHHLDRRELLGSKAPLTSPPRGDLNGDGKLSHTEYSKALKNAQQEKLLGASGGGELPKFHAFHETFTIRDQRATVRTHPRGLAMGLLQPGDAFVVSAILDDGKWVYGHVKGHPDRKGWVLRESLPEKHRPATANERAVDPGKPTNMAAKSGIEYYTGVDRKVMEFFQKGQDIPATAKLGYTTPVPRKHSDQPVQVYANYPCTDDNALKLNGKSLLVPPGHSLRFRYTPDGKNAVVLLSPEVLREMGVNRQDGIWAIVKMSDLAVPKVTMGAQTPPRPIRHVAA
jgi:hypothetical protein